MKYLKYILGLLVLLLIGFFAMGLIKPEISYECEIMVEKPTSEAWAVLEDESRMGEWMPGFQKIEHISGTKGSVGAVSNVYFLQDGKETVIKETITAIQPNESISMRFENEFMNMDYKMVLNSVEGKTKITTTTRAEGNGLMSKSIMAVAGGSIKAQEESNLANLKKTIEENTRNYSQVQ